MPLQQNKLDKALVKMIAAVFQPFSVVDDKGFENTPRHLTPKGKIHN